MGRVAFVQDDPQGQCVDLPGRESRVFIPTRRCELPDVSDDTPRGSARNCIFVPAWAASLTIELDPSVPIPCGTKDVLLCLARAGYDVWSCVLPVGGLEFPNSVVVPLLSQDWKELPPGYYDAQLRFNLGAQDMVGYPDATLHHNPSGTGIIGDPALRGWLLLHKDAPESILPVWASATPSRHRPGGVPALQHSINED